LFAEAGVAIDGSKFKAVNNRDKNFPRAKMQRRMAQIEESVARYLHQLDSADRQEPSLARTTKSTRLKEKIAKLKEEMQRLKALDVQMRATPDQQISLYRSRCPFDGHKRPRLRRRGLRAKRDESQSALPSRQAIVCHASSGRLEASALTVMGWCSA